MRTISIVTTSRSDYGIYKPIIDRIIDDADLNVRLLVTGMHLVPEFGSTINNIIEDGYPIGDSIEMLLASDTPEAISTSTGLGIIGFAKSYQSHRPDLLLVLGDRFEMHAATLAALPFNIPIAHIHGGEITKGAIDDSLRFSITKLSHVHFVATEEYKHRVIQMGEDPWRVVLSGAPGLDNINKTKLLTKQELENKFDIELKEKPLLITFHPVTKQYDKTEYYTDELLAALKNVDNSIIFTLPNADTSGRIIIDKIKQFVKLNNNAWMVDNLGTQAYFSLMSIAAAMIGNSSSGIIEAPSFKLPVVNIGIRQEGRVKANNIIDVDHDRASIYKGYKQAISPEFNNVINGLINPYGSGNASEIIVDTLKNIELDDKLLIKDFYDLNC